MLVQDRAEAHDRVGRERRPARPLRGREPRVEPPEDPRQIILVVPGLPGAQLGLGRPEPGGQRHRSEHPGSDLPRGGAARAFYGDVLGLEEVLRGLAAAAG